MNFHFHKDLNCKHSYVYFQVQVMNAHLTLFAKKEGIRQLVNVNLVMLQDGLTTDWCVNVSTENCEKTYTIKLGITHNMSSESMSTESMHAMDCCVNMNTEYCKIINNSS